MRRTCLYLPLKIQKQLFRKPNGIVFCNWESLGGVSATWLAVFFTKSKTILVRRESPIPACVSSHIYHRFLHLRKPANVLPNASNIMPISLIFLHTDCPLALAIGSRWRKTLSIKNRWRKTFPAIFYSEIMVDFRGKKNWRGLHLKPNSQKINTELFVNKNIELIHLDMKVCFN